MQPHFALNLPLNPVSFGQVSTAICREIFTRGLEPSIFPLGDIDLSSQGEDIDFNNFLKKCIDSNGVFHSRNSKAFKLWHLQPDALMSPSKYQNLLSFYELDSPTKLELNVAAQNDITYFSSRYSCEVFEAAGATNVKFLPLFFDENNFKQSGKKYFDDRITFTLCGKFEHRKHHTKILKAWVKKYGNNSKYYLNSALYNHFLSPEINSKLVSEAANPSDYHNVNYVPRMPSNKAYNDFLNSGDIVIGMSGGEGWGLPEFQSVALGKHAVILNAHAYKDWANSENSVLVEPSSQKTDVYDGTFFRKGININQGQIFDWNEDDFISGCEEAIKRVESSKQNEAGLKLKEDFSVKNTVDLILKDLK
tara:strand:+ start:1623 stop:2714 length:1092 start_codon:yes stop_codon:yes gene_type:complete